MNTYCTKLQGACSNLARRLAFTLAATVLTSVPVAAQVEIAQQPLTVAEPLPPNIMLLFDDSGSMFWSMMPDTVPATSGVRVDRHAYTRNTIYYNPNITYSPWKNQDGSSYPAADFNRVSTRKLDVRLNDGDRMDLSATAQCFHELKTPGLNPAVGTNYFRYRLSGGKLFRCTAINSPLDTSTNQTNNSILREPRSDYGDACTDNTGCVEVVGSVTWDSGTDTVTRTIAEERQNFANWFHYYRTRNKMAKASISHAFSSIGPDFRLGFFTINSGGTQRSIPVTGDFRVGGTNRTNWFNTMLAAPAGGVTPLQQALQRVGEYYKDTTDTGPWGPRVNGQQLSCRRSYTILTTDGFWTVGLPPSGIGNSDDLDGPLHTNAKGDLTLRYTPEIPFKDAWSDTLADVAMHYWKNDLRPTLKNDVPTSPSNPAFWQHMITYGVSIGLQGTMDPTTTDVCTATWPDPYANQLHRIDDLFHATVNGRGEMIVAKDPSELTEGLQRMLRSISEKPGNGAAGASSTSALTTGSLIYFTKNYGTSGGDVEARRINPTTGAWEGVEWEASAQLPAWGARNIYFNSRGGPPHLPFVAANVSSTAQVSALSNPSLGSLADIVNYIRGDQSKEEAQPGGKLRNRLGNVSTAGMCTPGGTSSSLPLAPFVHSQLVYVGKPNANFFMGATFTGASDYGSFVADKSGRTPTLYVGGNGGMLHAFNAITGAESYAFLPAGAIENNLGEIADPAFSFRYFVDGELTVADAYINDSWRTILVGSLGRGGRSVFALDVTNPANISFLWEKTATEVPQLGNTLGKPIVAQVADNDWRVLLGNGANGSNDEAELIMIEIDSGAVTVVPTGVSGNNGLSAIRAWDSNGYGFTDTAYAGDLRGNVWRFSGLGSSPGVDLLFSASAGGVDQPITAAPTTAINPDTGHLWVFVGTGRYLNQDDQDSTALQSWYGLIDNGSSIGGRAADLVQRSIINTGLIGGRYARVLASGDESDIVGAGVNKRGWYIDFTAGGVEEGERMLAPNSFYNKVLLGTSFIPDASDPCNPGGRGMLWAINPFSGARLNQTVFDVNRDGYYTDTLGGLNVSVMEIGSDVGLSESAPGLVSGFLLTPDEDPPRLNLVGDGAVRGSWREILGN